MNFQAIPTVPQSQEILDKAFALARKKADSLKSTKKSDNKQNIITAEKIAVVRKTMTKSLLIIVDKFPNFENLPDFYEELCSSQFNLDQARESLGRINGVSKSINALSNEFSEKAREMSNPLPLFNQYVGRISALVNKLEKPLLFLESVRKTLQTFPYLRDDHITVALAGFPNVGKSTLLSQLTTAKPKIANYAFTTKTLNVGYYKQGYHDIQVIDTPGTLARFDRMNEVEKMAYLALKYEADIIVMVFDPTPSYSLSEQEKLLEQIKEHDKPLLVYLSKTDIVSKEDIQVFSSRYECITNIDDLKNRIGSTLPSL